jgi:hypothetical protein
VSRPRKYAHIYATFRGKRYLLQSAWGSCIEETRLGYIEKFPRAIVYVLSSEETRRLNGNALDFMNAYHAYQNGEV